jgi:hypothetical protein
MGRTDLGDIEMRRVERGVQLACEPAGDGRYRVTGGNTTHWVDLISRDHPRCDCGDYLWRDAICKHIIAARLREGDEQVLFHVGALVRSLRKLAEEKENAPAQSHAA